MYKYVTMGYHGIQVEMMSEDWKILHRCFLDDEAGENPGCWEWLAQQCGR